MRIFRLVVVLALAYASPELAAAHEPGAVEQGIDQEQVRLKQLFQESDYSRCDALFVSKTFEMSIDDAKVYIGQKIAWGTTDILDGDLTAARDRGKKDSSLRCPFYQSDFNLGDAEVLAVYWGLGLSETKVRVEDKILWGNEGYLRDTVLPEARVQFASGKPVEEHPSTEAADQLHWERFQSSAYSLCDAHFMAKMYEMSLDESKVYIGQKLDWGNTDILERDLTQAREQGKQDRTWRCQFYQSGYTYDDAEALAAYWGLPISETKVRVEDKILWGNEAYFRDQVLPEARKQHVPHAEGITHEDTIAHHATDAKFLKKFQKSKKYDYCHAKMLEGTWFGATAYEAKHAIGYKIKMGWTETVDTELQGVRQRHEAAGTVPCSFHETRYTPEDAMKLARAWGQSVSEVKAFVEQKYAWGDELILRDTLKKLK